MPRGSHLAQLYRQRGAEARRERRLLLLNLRKGYLKQGEWFGSKVYLSQIQQLVLSERLAGEEDDGMRQSPRSASEVGASASTSCGGSIGDLRSTSHHSL